MHLDLGQDLGREPLQLGVLAGPGLLLEPRYGLVVVGDLARDVHPVELGPAHRLQLVLQGQVRSIEPAQLLRAFGVGQRHQLLVGLLVLAGDPLGHLLDVLAGRLAGGGLAEA